MSFFIAAESAQSGILPCVCCIPMFLVPSLGHAAASWYDTYCSWKCHAIGAESHSSSSPSVFVFMSPTHLLTERHVKLLLSFSFPCLTPVLKPFSQCRTFSNALTWELYLQWAVLSLILEKCCSWNPLSSCTEQVLSIKQCHAHNKPRGSKLSPADGRQELTLQIDLHHKRNSSTPALCMCRRAPWIAPIGRGETAWRMD